MSQRWCYRFLDQGLGPVEFRELQRLAWDGTIGPDDLVRDDAGGEWRCAGSVNGLFPESADTDDLAGMLDDAAAPATRDRGRRGDCYYLTPDGVAGPIGFEDLAALAGSGQLAPDSIVRIGAEADWIEAGVIVGLFPSEPAAVGAADELADFQIVAEAPVERMGPPDRTWYCRVLRQDMGPFTFDDLYAMALSGQLSDSDEVREGNGEWVAAGAIVGLFANAPSPIAREPAENAQRSIAPQRQAVRSSKMAPKAERRPATEQSRPPAADRPAPPEPTRRESPCPVTPSVNPERTPPAAVSRPTAAAPRTPPTSFPPPRPTAPIPVPRPRKAMGNPLAGLSGSMGSLFGGIRFNWKHAGVVVAVLAVAAVIYGGNLLSSNAGGAAYAETRVMWDRAQQLRQANASDGEWQSFKAEVQPRSDELRAELQETANARQRLLQLMLYCHRDCLPAILNGGPQGADGPWEEMETYMNEAAGQMRD